MTGELAKGVGGESRLWSAGDRETGSSVRGIPAFIGKSSAAPTPAPHAASYSPWLSAGAQRRTHFKRGGAAFKGGGKY